MVQYKYSSHRTRHTKNIRKQRSKFPKLLLKVIDISDIILEVLDARFIEETRNKAVEKLIKDKRKRIIYVLNKSDLTDRRKTELEPHIFVSCKNRKGISELRDRIKIESKRVKKSAENRYDKIHVGIIGYPNTGKSSVINMLIGKTSAKTGAEAGFTKGLQKLNLVSGILLIDSPGVIPIEEYSHKDGNAISKHVKVGARTNDKLRDPEIAVAYLIKEYPKAIEKFYKIDFNHDSEELIEILGKKRGFLKKGGIVDEDKTARAILDDWRQGKIRV